MVLSTEWSQVEVIDLVNDGNGLGFILVGGRSTGVVIKYLTPGGVAERDGRLQCGDHLLQIGEVNLRGFSSEQVATVLRQTGAQVRLIVARPVEPAATDFQTFASHAPIIPTKLLSDQEELSRHLFQTPGFGDGAATAASVGSEANALVASATTTTTVTVSAIETSAAAAAVAAGGYLPTPDTELADLPLPPLPLPPGMAVTPAPQQRSCPKDLDIVPFSLVSPPPLPPKVIVGSGNSNSTSNSLGNLHHFTENGAESGGVQLYSTTTIKARRTSVSNVTRTGNTMDHIETVIAAKAVTSVSNGVAVSGAQLPPLPLPPSSLPLPLQQELALDVLAANDTETEHGSTASSTDDYIDSPETETYEVVLRKNVYGLGITVAGYVCEEEDLSGIFVKSIIEGSAAEMSGQIQINDRIVAVDGRTLAGVTNHQAVEILRNTDIEVHLTLERFLRGRKYEHLQNELTELKGDVQSQNSLQHSPSIATLSWLPPKSDADSIATEAGGALLIMDFGDLPSRDTVESNMSQMLDRSDHSNGGSANHHTTPTTPEGAVKALTNGRATHINGNVHDETSEIHERNAKSETTSVTTPTSKKQANGSLKTPTAENNLITSSGTAVAMQVTAATTTPTSAMSTLIKQQQQQQHLQQLHQQQQQHLRQYPHNLEALKVAWKSLGISLEGTVDVECGIEKRPHHYIRSILEDGPVGRQGILKPGDELLQVNEHKLQGLKHTEVVKILKELPSHVKLVCARGPRAPSVINTSQNPEAFETRSLLPGGHLSLQNLMIKAQSESSLYTSSTATLTDQQRSKSLENVSGLALWSSDATTIEIEKTDLGFGFSILDYQDPLDPEGSVIVIRGLIRGGAAEATNEIFPGDRLVSVGEHNLNGLSLDEAVAILKGMPLGLTKLGICRPLCTSDSNIASPVGETGGDGSSGGTNSAST